MDDLAKTLSFYKGKTVLVTGHTGFKGSWLSKILIMSGAKVIGYSLEPTSQPNLYSLLGIENKMVSIYGDVRDYEKLSILFNKYKPEIVFHLAAQPIVRESYINPLYTYEVNVIGTANICECIRHANSVKSFLNITTDKVYENNDKKGHLFKEEEKLDGFDPYSNSKSCSELVTHSYDRCFFKNLHISCSTVRAGNVIGGGDFAKDRIIPDAVRSLKKHETLVIRNPHSIRPYQHVFEALGCYLMIAKKQYNDITKCGSYNVGPESENAVCTEKLVRIFYSNFSYGNYEICNDNGPHEANFLELDNKKVKESFGWESKLNIYQSLELTAEWYKIYLQEGDILDVSIKQIERFFNI